MTADRFTLEVRRREECGTRISRRLRRDGLVPGVIYGRGKGGEPFVVEETHLRKALGYGLNALFDVVLDGSGEPRHAVVKDYQLHPTRSRLLHIDFQEVRLDRPIQATVPLDATGTAPGVVRGGLLNVAVRELTVEGLPAVIPERIEIDVSDMEIGDTKTLADLVPPPGITILGEPDDVVVLVSATRGAREEEGVEGEEEGEAGPGEGEERPAGEGDEEA